MLESLRLYQEEELPSFNSNDGISSSINVTSIVLLLNDGNSSSINITSSATVKRW
jgi:hypothetical protein